MAETRKFTISLRTNGYTQSLKDGTIKIPGIEFDFIDIKPQVAAFRRMVRSQEFDICELASTTYLVSKAYGRPYKALPTFFNRRFHHHGILIHKDSDIKHPKDLEGRKFGVRAYSVTTGVWTRGVLQNEYGVDIDKVTWVVDDEEHVQELPLPKNVIRVPEGKSLAGMMAAREIDAGMTGNAGLGRVGAPKDGWNSAEVPSLDNYKELIPDAEPIEEEWFRRTGILPCHPTIVIRDDVAAANPDLPRKLFDALVASKNIYLERLRRGEVHDKTDRNFVKLMKVVGEDPLPYGLEANRPAITTLLQYAVQQKLIPSPLNIDDVFYAFDVEPTKAPQGAEAT